MELVKLSDEAMINELHRRFKCRQYPQKKSLIFIGPPGAGKGTHSYRLVTKFCLCQLSTGDLLRNEIKFQTDVGKKIKNIMDKGQFVSDDIVIDLLKKNMNKPECAQGVVFDGFPRSVKQAQKLDEILHLEGRDISRVLYFDVPDGCIIQRVTGRLIHEGSGRTYHVKFNPPKKEGRDDVTGEPLIKRSDDSEEVLKKRLEGFHTSTKPLIDYYESKGLLSRI